MLLWDVGWEIGRVPSIISQSWKWLSFLLCALVKLTWLADSTWGLAAFNCLLNLLFHEESEKEKLGENSTWKMEGGAGKETPRKGKWAQCCIDPLWCLINNVSCKPLRSGYKLSRARGKKMRDWLCCCYYCYCRCCWMLLDAASPGELLRYLINSSIILMQSARARLT